MKNLLTSLVVLTAINLVFPACFAQGSLTPPGAPAPTMKSLAQIEPRIDVLTLPAINGLSLYAISNAGSYYLSGNITSTNDLFGIWIESSDVTLDLNGFAVIGSGSSSMAVGIFVHGALTGIAIRNGSVRGWSGGVLAINAFNCQFDHLRSYSNNVISGGYGFRTGNQVIFTDCISQTNGIGIITGNNCVLRDCVAAANNFEGILAGFNSSVVNCAASANGGPGIAVTGPGTITGCTAQGNQVGIQGYDQTVILACTAQGNTQSGIAATRSTVTSCTAQGNPGDGIQVLNECVVLNNTAIGNGNTGGAATQGGIHVIGNRNRIDSNHSVDNNCDGILVGTNLQNNIIIRNTTGGNAGFQYRIAGLPGVGQPPGGPNVVGPIVTDATNSSANAWANFQ